MKEHNLKLSMSEPGISWIKQFKTQDDQRAAAAMLDAMLLLNESDIADGIRSGIDKLLETSRWPRHHIALYAEREFGTAAAFKSENIIDQHGRTRLRATHYEGAIKPTRGKKRIGSEGHVAYIISQAVESNRVFKNHPNPNGIRAKSSPVRTIAIVTDFLGTGSRVCKMLDKFWRVPSVKSWVSRGYVKFAVISAAGTVSALSLVRTHHLKPDTFNAHIVPTVRSWPNQVVAKRWDALIQAYGPKFGRGGVDRSGYNSTTALLAISSRIPNNTPAIIHESAGSLWRALYDGAAPKELKWHFRLQTDEDIVARAAELHCVTISADLDIVTAKVVLLLQLPYAVLRGRNIDTIAEVLGMPVQDAESTLDVATSRGLLTSKGRVTDAGHEILDANTRGVHRKKVVASRDVPYYPKQLRVPRIAV